MVTYALQIDVAAAEPAELSERLGAVLQHAMRWLITVSESEASVPEAEGKWSAKQVIGHLTDSAVNNLARIVRMQIASGQSMQGYEQSAWVDLQHYAEREWSEVLALWFALNEHLRQTVKYINKARLANEGTVEGETVSLGFLVVDYIAHMEHHLRAVRTWLHTTESPLD